MSHASKLRAEITAVWETLKIAVAPLRIHVDSAKVVQGVQKGREGCISSGRDGVDLWKEVWDRMGDIGEGIEAVRVPAHSTWWGVICGRTTARDKGSNDLADQGAKRALKEALWLSPTAVVNTYIARAAAWATWVANYPTKWANDETTEDGQGNREQAREGGEAEGSRNTMGHEIWDVGELWVYSECAQQSGNSDARRVLKSSPCGGCASGRALAHVTDKKNSLWNKNSLSTQRLQLQGARLVKRSCSPERTVDAKKGEMEGTCAKMVKQSVQELGAEVI